MAIEDERITTNISFNGDEVVFKITNHYEWDNNDRKYLSVIIKEIKTYIAAVISGEIYKNYPDARGKNRVIEIVSKYPPNTEAKKIFRLLEKSSTTEFRFRLLDED